MHLSAMMHRAVPPLLSSGDDSNSDEDISWKKRSSSACKRKFADDEIEINSLKPNKRQRFSIWKDVANERVITEALPAANLYKTADPERGVEGYFVKDDIDTIDFCSVPYGSESLDANSPPELVRNALIALLKEPNEDIIERVVRTLGVKKALQFYLLTQNVERKGGLYYADGSQRRSVGGVYLNLIKGSDCIEQSAKKIIFAAGKSEKEKMKMRRRRVQQKFSKTKPETSASLSDKNEVSDKQTRSLEVRNEIMEEGELASSDEDENHSPVVQII